MAQVLKEEISQKIYDSALKSFYKNGYKGAKMRDIADGAGIPVGLVYSYFPSKTALFEKIVQPIYILFESILTEEINDDEPRMDSSLFDELGYLLNTFKDSREEFVILIDKSEGTKYENIKKDVIEMAEAHIKKGLLLKVAKENKDIDDFFFHMLANNFMESIFEIGRHYKNEQWAEQMLTLVAKQYFYGVNSF